MHVYSLLYLAMRPIPPEIFECLLKALDSFLAWQWPFVYAQYFSTITVNWEKKRTYIMTIVFWIFLL